jgi:hypothetical protein
MPRLLLSKFNRRWKKPLREYRRSKPAVAGEKDNSEQRNRNSESAYVGEFAEINSARGGSRTPMTVRSGDFESPVSASSTTRASKRQGSRLACRHARAQGGYHNFYDKPPAVPISIRRFVLGRGRNCAEAARVEDAVREFCNCDSELAP